MTGAGIVWGLIPARGGSKSIPYKNLATLGGLPLLDYVASAGKASKVLSRVICSTDDDRIAAHARTLSIEVDRRPAQLARDDTPVVDVVCELLARAQGQGTDTPEIVVLLQPTSPFLLPRHIDSLVEAMRADPAACSGQTIIACAHNLHAVNQRSYADGYVKFVFERERQAAYNKQRKEKHYLFGNLVATRTENLRTSKNLFASPSVGIEIPRVFGFDVDEADDIAMANAFLANRVVELPHLTSINSD